MRFDIKKLVVASALGFVTILGTSEIASAQRNRNDDRRDDQRQQERVRQQNAKIEQERLRAEQRRQAEWVKQNQRIQAEQRRQDDRNRNDSRWGNGRWDGNNNSQNANRYRVYRNGSYYKTDHRGAELLRQAVNAGYQQGFQAARNDRNNRRQVIYSNSNIYQSGSFGYQSYVDRSQYQYYFRQGFQRGYQDGSNNRYQDNYNGQYEYGYNNNGSMTILGTILSQILNIQTY